jgi:formate hydrogenlyase subunit 6/NADH:ubiquinone oxidoreductase subunit I
MVATRGLPPTGGVIQQVKRMLKAKGVTLQAGFYVNMPQNYIPWFDVPDELKQQRLFQHADAKIRQIAAILHDETQKYDFEPLGFMLPFRNAPYLSKANDLDRNFYLQNGSCNGCAVCVQVCPVSNIVLNEGMPEWKHTCQECLACLNFCPKQAIQYGKKTANRSRYHHPEVTLKDIMAQKSVSM